MLNIRLGDDPRDTLMSMQKLLIATKNPGKVAEFADMMADLDVEWLSLADVGITADVEENGTTFSENAWLKAEAYSQMAGIITLADDSGLEVDALDGAPGLYTARYGGSELSHEQRYQLLLQNIADVALAQRSARFRCVIAVADGRGQRLTEAEGICEGYIALAPAGAHGFGYDPVFVPEGQGGLTMAQLLPEQKHPISHRGRAIAKLAPELHRLLGQ